MTFLFAFFATYAIIFLLYVKLKIIRYNDLLQIFGICIISIPISVLGGVAWWLTGVCIDETLRTIPIGSGDLLEVRSTDCDCIAHWSYISVLASRGRLGRQTTLFSYTPDRDDDPGPDVGLVDGGRILISIAAVGHVAAQLSAWHGMPVEYRIGAIADPSRPAGAPPRP